MADLLTEKWPFVSGLLIALLLFLVYCIYTGRSITLSDIKIGAPYPGKDSTGTGDSNTNASKQISSAKEINDEILKLNAEKKIFESLLIDASNPVERKIIQANLDVIEWRIKNSKK